MNNILNREILPILRRCAICHKPPGKAHLKQDPETPAHEYTRDPALPIWRGWHCFRRALATDLQHAGAPVLLAQGALRHADANTTLRVYSKTVPDAVRSSLQQRTDSLHGIEFQDILRTAERPSGAQPEIVN